MIKNEKLKGLIIFIIDGILILTSYFIAIIFRFKFRNISMKEMIEVFIGYLDKITFFTFLYLLVFFILKQYKSLWIMDSVEEFMNGLKGTLLVGIVTFFISIPQSPRVPLMVTIMSCILIIFFCNGIRIGWRATRRTLIYLNSPIVNYKKVLVVGAGETGAFIEREFRKDGRYNKRVVAFVDDNKKKIGSNVNGVKVLGDRNDISKIVEERGIQEIIIAISDANSENFRNIIDICKESGAKVKVMPNVSKLEEGTGAIRQIRDVKVEDLLGRETVKLDYAGILEYIEGKVVLVTGGGGSIGSELCRQIVKFNPKVLIILDIYENNAYDIQNELLSEYKDLNLVTLIASVRDKERLREIFSKYKPNVVFHAAAHKHVPLMEESPCEAFKNNNLGTLNTAEVSSEFNVERFVLISTDKAVNPTNIMGASKRICEMIIQSIDKESKTEFVAVRFGNVLGSNGSVVPLFKKQIKSGGPITLTHKEITRYFMTIPEAAQLVLQAGAYAKGGEIFILDMGKPVKIYDLAVNLIKLSGLIPEKDIKIEITGLRPGEKLYEELLMNEEGLTKTAHDKIFVARPGDFNLKEVKENINELIKISSKGDIIKTKEKLKEVVPTYIGDIYSNKLKNKDIQKENSYEKVTQKEVCVIEKKIEKQDLREVAYDKEC